MRGNNFRVLFLLASLLLASITAYGQATAFTYQGKLTDNGNAANGQYDFQFKLFDSATVGIGNQFGSLVAVSNVTVTNGVFTVQLDFGACPTCFNGAARFLEITVKPTSGSTSTTLSPRQPITANPYAIRSLAAATADALSVVCTNCVTSSQIGSVNGSAVTGTIPVASVPSGSGFYIQNTTSPQAASNFNISGNGAAGGTLSAVFVNATTRYDLGGPQVLSAAGTDNLFAGINAGANNSFGTSNSFFGARAGQANFGGSQNAFFGADAGTSNTDNRNAFFGTFAGRWNTSGSDNTFFGFAAGSSNSTAYSKLENGRLSLVVKDEGAEYPLRVDRGNFGKISTFFRLFGKILKRSRVIFALVRDADLESQIETPNAGLIIGRTDHRKRVGKESSKNV